MTFGGGYDTAVDMYSLGVTLYILLAGSPPSSKPRCGSAVLDDDDDYSLCSSSSSSSSEGEFQELNSSKTTTAIFSKKNQFAPIDFPTKQWRNISSCAKDLIRRMLHPDPSLRIKADDALQHEWILLNKHQSTSKLKTFDVP